MAMNAAMLVSEIDRCGSSAPSELAMHFGISERTVRDHVKRANEALSGIARISYSRAHGGYVLVVDDRAGFDAWLERNCSLSAEPQSPSGERVSYLLRDLLQRGDYVTIDDLSQVLFVSRASISADLKHVEESLAKYGLALEKRPRHGIRVTGPELARRLCLAEATAGHLDGTGTIVPGEDLGPLFEAISSIVDEALDTESLAINSFSHQNLLVHISIACMRIRRGSFVPPDSVPLAKISGTREHKVARAIAERLSSRFSIELPESEIAYIAIHLAGKRVIDEQEAAADGEGLVITDEVWGVAERMVEQVWRSFRFDFRGDMELLMNLARHIVPLAVRLRYRLNLDNPILTDIKERYPLAFSMAADTGSVLEDAYGALPSEAEVGYIALAFALALERQVTEAPRKRVLVVCASGAGTARLLSYKIEREFGEHIETIAVRNASQLSMFDFSTVDYVFTTVPLGREVPVPVRQITLFLGDEDRRTMRELLQDGPAQEGAARFFPRELFFAHCSFADRKEALGFLCERLHEADDLPQDLERLVWERERLAPTAFGGGVALPHPIEAVGTRTVAATALLDTPIIWNEVGQEVSAIFLVSVAREPEPDLDVFYRKAARLFNSREAISYLVEHQDHDVLMRALRDRNLQEPRERKR